MPDILAILFPATFVAVAFWEALRPSRQTTTSLKLRWFGNIVLLGFTWLIARALPFLSSYGAAVIAQRNGWGLFNVVTVPTLVAAAASFVALDFIAYWSHRLLHKISLLWRLHAIHHSDTDLDVTTTVRHHPLEILVQMLFDASCAIVLGFPPEAIALFGGVALIVQTINHGNVILPPGLRWMNAWIMTPDLHRLHHSVLYAENNSNFGEIIPLWDRLFGTLKSAPEGELHIGLPELADARYQRLDKLLIQPMLVAIAPPPMPLRTGEFTHR